MRTISAPRQPVRYSARPVQSANRSPGKAYRREMVLTLTADLRSGHLKVLDTGSLQMVMKASYHVPQSDIAPIISTLTCQKVISSDKKTGRITVLLAGK